jgi:aldehyde:ferredoxin oxidoreductase
MLYAWTGVNLEVDLSRGKTEKVKSDPKLIEDYLGGKGTNAKLYWDRLSPEVDPFSPDNLMIVGTGLLCGTMVPGANNTSITFKSPLTGLYSYSNGKGFFAPELKYAGYDKIVISGKSPTPVYLWINDDHVEIRDASHLWGKNTHETQRLIREELKRDIQVLAIGPAGENRVMAASVEHSTGNSFSRGGVGAVMGDKKLKAIAVYGTKDINIAKPAKLMEVCDQLLSRVDVVRQADFTEDISMMLAVFGGYHNWGRPTTPEFQQQRAGIAAVYRDYRSKNRIREVACYNCPVRCKQAYCRPDGTYSYLHCGGWGIGFIASNIIDMDFAMTYYRLCELNGLDCMAVGNYIGFAIDLYERGILTKEDTGGIHLEWENHELVFSLIDKITRREGIGDLLADGVYRAARKIGKGAEEYAIHIKKQEPLNMEVRGSRAATVLATQARHDTMRVISILDSVWAKSREEREKFIKEDRWRYPKEWQEMFLETEMDFHDYDYERRIMVMDYEEQFYALCDMLGICFFYTGMLGYPVIKSPAVLADLVSYAAGIDVDEAEAMKIARRTITFDRAIQLREGMRGEDDTVPARLFSRREAGAYDNFTHEMFNKWLNHYYKVKGWNNEGIPTKETLDELGLDYVSEDLEQRGIYKKKKVKVTKKDSQKSKKTKLAKRDSKK